MGNTNYISPMSELRYRRIKNGFASAEALANYIGVTKRTVLRWERGDVKSLRLRDTWYKRKESDSVAAYIYDILNAYGLDVINDDWLYKDQYDLFSLLVREARHIRRTYDEWELLHIREGVIV